MTGPAAEDFAETVSGLTSHDIEGELLASLRSATQLQVQNAQKAVAKTMNAALEMIMVSCAATCAQSLRNQRQELLKNAVLQEQTPKSSYDVELSPSERSPKSMLGTARFFPEESVDEEDIDSGDADPPVVEIATEDSALGQFLTESKLMSLNGMTEGADNLSTNWNALHYAIYRNRIDIVRSLIEHKKFKGMNKLTSNGTSSFLGACIYGNEETVSLLLRCNRYRMLNQSSGKMHPLTAAISRGEPNIVRLLLQDPRIDVTAVRSPMGSSILHVAVPQLDTDISEMILNHDGVDVNLRNKIGQTALHMAIDKTTVNAILMCKRFSSANAQDTSGKTALHNAAMQNKLEVVAALLQSAAFTAVNAVDKLGWTALHVAAMKGHVELVQCMMRLCDGNRDDSPTLDLAKTDHKGRSALGIARERGHEAIIDILVRKGQRQEALRAASKIWQVVGGQEHGGILVRDGSDLASTAFPERLGVGATVAEIDKRGNRLQFRKVWGTGPDTGWVNIQLHNTEILKKLVK